MGWLEKKGVVQYSIALFANGPYHSNGPIAKEDGKVRQ